MDPYNKAVHKNIYKTMYTANRQPGVLYSKNVGLPHCNIKISSDNYYKFIVEDNKTNCAYPYNFIIYDEIDLKTKSEESRIIYFLNLINKYNITNIKFYLSDSTLPYYNQIMNKIGWKHSDVTQIFFSIDRNPLKRKVNDLNLELAKGRLIIPEDKLLWISNATLSKLETKVEKGIIFRARKLKELIDVYEKDIEKYYNISNLNDYDKTYMAYDYVKNKLNIKFAGQYVEEKEGKQVLKQFSPCYISEPLGTYLKKEGVCEGQARLISVLLNNPIMKVDSTTIRGMCPYGAHAWVGVNINNKLYECCPTMKGVFSNLDMYVPDKEEVYTKIYERSFLTQNEKEKIKRKVVK